MKKIIKTFNNLIQKTIFKVKNKTNNKFNISGLNKVLITLIGSLFLYIFYLLLPSIYDKTWVEKKIKKNLLSEFKIDLTSTEDISYRILPSPYFLIKDTNILLNEPNNKKIIGEVRNLKVFINQGNFFDKEKITLKNVIIKDANFSLSGIDLKKFNSSINDKLSDKKIQFDKGNIFFKDNINEIFAIVKINDANLFFDDKALHNKFMLKGSIFSIPFIFEIKSKNDQQIEKKISFNAKSLNLEVINDYIVDNDGQAKGNNIVTFLGTLLNSEFKLDDNSVIFFSKNSRIKNNKIDYNGILSINPFNLDLKIDLNDNNISKLLNFNPILIELLKSGILFNSNISLKTLINANSNEQKNLFQNSKIYLDITSGKINFDKTKFFNSDIGSFELSNSNLFVQDNRLILNTDLFFDIKNSNELFSSLNTKKKSRRKINNVLINFDYDFSNNVIKFNNAKIDNNKVGDQILNIIEEFEDNNLNNKVKTKRLLNNILDAYEG
ncbi:hypothetical protein N8871_01325 [Candidatus Pelagibacter sp.]|nr:hypothetical protein [Candidatus Pelagibacter sp.]